MKCSGCEGFGSFHLAGTNHSVTCGKCKGSGITHRCNACGNYHA